MSPLVVFVLECLLIELSCCWNANLRVTQVTPSTVSLLWQPEGIPAGSISGYCIYRFTGTNIKVGTSLNPWFSDIELLSNTTYLYSITWFDKDTGQESPNSELVSAHTLSKGSGRILLNYGPDETKISGRAYLYNFQLETLLLKQNYYIVGFVTPRSNGNYSFLLSSTHPNLVVRLYISSNDSVDSKTLIATLQEPISSPISLLRNRAYYIELDVVGTEDVSTVIVGWEMAGSKVIPIPGDYLSPLNPTYQTDTASFNPDISKAMQQLSTFHPRLGGSGYHFARLRKQIAEYPNTYGKLFQNILNDADKLFNLPPVKYEPGTVRGLDVAREIATRMEVLGMAYQITQNNSFAERAWKDISAAADFPDWKYDEIFLTTAETSYGFGIGYDWFYDYWTPSQRTIIADALVKFGLFNAIGTYTNKTSPKNPVGPHPYWPTAGTNWNFVCNGANGVAALALAGDQNIGITAEQIEFILEKATTGVYLAFQLFKPDGVWYESPDYWAYSMKYISRFLSTMESAWGTDLDLGDSPGFSSTAFTILSFTGNTIWRYGDASSDNPQADSMTWFAIREMVPLASWWEGTEDASPYNLLFYLSNTQTSYNFSLGLDRVFTVNDLTGEYWATLRSKWDDVAKPADTQSILVGFKTGHPGVDPDNAHSHLDTGSFVLYALGVPWAIDIGSGNYDVDGYWNTSSTRWNYYRLRAEGHNTLSINTNSGPDQTVDSAAKIINHHTEPDNGWAIADLTPSYAVAQISRVLRGVKLINRNMVLIQDEIEADAQHPVPNIYWFMHFNSSALIRSGTYKGSGCSMDSLEIPIGNPVTLTIDGRASLWLFADIPGIQFLLMKALPLPSSPHPVGNDDNSNYCKLALNTNDSKLVTLPVYFLPFTQGITTTNIPLTIPLKYW